MQLHHAIPLSPRRNIRAIDDDITQETWDRRIGIDIISVITGVGTVSITFFLRLIRVIWIGQEVGRRWLRLSLNLGETEKGGEGTRLTGSEETPFEAETILFLGWKIRKTELACKTRASAMLHASSSSESQPASSNAPIARRPKRQRTE